MRLPVLPKPLETLKYSFKRIELCKNVFKGTPGSFPILQDTLYLIHAHNKS